jgi:hypothetical protein
MGGTAQLGIRTTPLLKVIDHPSAEVRRLAARLLPERFLGRFVEDQDDSVRYAVAPRLPASLISEMLQQDPGDLVLREVLRSKRLAETKDRPPGLRSGDGVKQHDGPELSDAWYKSAAERLMQDYGRRMEFGWEPAAVKNFARHSKMTSGVEIDEERLLDAVLDACMEREEAVMERPDKPIHEAAQWLRARAIAETSTGIPLLGEEEEDPVKNLEAAGTDSSEFIDGAERLFSIKEAAAPAAVRKFRLGEGIARPLTVPIVGTLPHGGAPRAVDERVLDAYVRRWNDRAAMQGEPVRISWSPSPSAIDRIGFSVVLR